MRHQPFFIHRIAGKAAAELVVHPAGSHLFAGVGDHPDAIGIVRPRRLPQHKRRFAGAWEFRLVAKSAKTWIVSGLNLREAVGEQGVVKLGIGVGLASGGLGQSFPHSLGVLLNERTFFRVIPKFINAITERHEITLWKISASKKRILVGRHKYTHRPAAASGGSLYEGHINFIYIRSFLAVELDVDKVFVEQGTNFLILKTFALHHVAPVAGGVADG